jgi:hypothetical protein
MSDHQTYIYEVYTGELENGQQILVQIFREPIEGRVLHSQIAFKTVTGDSWSPPIQLEVKK